MIKVGIVGATGYAGSELVRLLTNHPKVEIVELISHSFAGKFFSEIYPNLNGNCTLMCRDMEYFQNHGIKNCNVVFSALPHGMSEDIALACYKLDIYFIDIGADFRLEKEEDYVAWYGLNYKYAKLHKKAQYGLSELYRDKIKKSKIIANPGCYPTSIILALAPALNNNLIDLSSIIIDSKSGLTGSGRNLSLASHYTECNESVTAYKIGCHRHIPEIEQELSKIAGDNVKVTFTPHLIPINRGIFSTMYSKLSKNISLDEIIEIYKGFYKHDKFIRILSKGNVSKIKSVRGSNYCDISISLDERTNMIIVTSAIDNMVKGAAGQAIQNMNLMLSFDEDLGLSYIPLAF